MTDFAVALTSFREAIADSTDGDEALGRIMDWVTVNPPADDYEQRAQAEAAAQLLGEFIANSDEAFLMARTAVDSGWRRAGIVPHWDRAEEPAAPGSRPATLSVAEILANPEWSAPPEPVVPRFVWGGRSSLLWAREKMGKSTAARGIVGAVSTGRRFLGEDTKRGPVLWVALEEHFGDTARLLGEFGCDPETVFILRKVQDPLQDLQAAIHHTNPVVVVIDTLAAFVGTLGLESGSAAAWTPVVLGLSDMAHETGAGFLILHHGTKNGKGYRDSSAIGAGVDMILGMTPGGDSDSRKIESKGRWPTEDFAIRLVGDRYDLAAGELSLDLRVLLYIEKNPGASQSQVRQKVQGQARLIDRAIRQLLERTAIDDIGDERGHKFVIAGQGSGQGGLSL